MSYHAAVHKISKDIVDFNPSQKYELEYINICPCNHYIKSSFRMVLGAIDIKLLSFKGLL